MIKRLLGKLFPKFEDPFKAVPHVFPDSKGEGLFFQALELSKLKDVDYSNDTIIEAHTTYTHITEYLIYLSDKGEQYSETYWKLRDMQRTLLNKFNHFKESTV
jgi:hypothetical protein